MLTGLWPAGIKTCLVSRTCGWGNSAHIIYVLLTMVSKALNVTLPLHKTMVFPSAAAGTSSGTV